MKKHLNILFSSLLGMVLMFVALPLHAGPKICPLDEGYSYGDVNGDQSSDVLDLIAMVNEILELGEVIGEHPVEFCGDVNCDADLNIQDLVIEANLILGTALTIIVDAEGQCFPEPIFDECVDNDSNRNGEGSCGDDAEEELWCDEDVYWDATPEDYPYPGMTCDAGPVRTLGLTFLVPLDENGDAVSTWDDIETALVIANEKYNPLGLNFVTDENEDVVAIDQQYTAWNYSTLFAEHANPNNVNVILFQVPSSDGGDGEPGEIGGGPDAGLRADDDDGSDDEGDDDTDASNGECNERTSECDDPTNPCQMSTFAGGGASNAFSSTAQYPWYGNMIKVNANNLAQGETTLSHELGHYFGLLHTHAYAQWGDASGPDPVEWQSDFEDVFMGTDGTAGDWIASTPFDCLGDCAQYFPCTPYETATADHQMEQWNEECLDEIDAWAIDAGLVQDDTEEDDGSHFYNPSTTNLMSYYSQTREHLIAEQGARMRLWLDYRLNNSVGDDGFTLQER